MNASNEQRLMRVLNVVRNADRGSACRTRAALLNASEGTIPFEMLTYQRFDEARIALGRGHARPVPPLAELSPEAKAARRPLPPEELYDARNERAHREPGRARAARTARNAQNESA